MLLRFGENLHVSPDGSCGVKSARPPPPSLRAHGIRGDPVTKDIEEKNKSRACFFFFFYNCLLLPTPKLSCLARGNEALCSLGQPRRAPFGFCPRDLPCRKPRLASPTLGSRRGGAARWGGADGGRLGRPQGSGGRVPPGRAGAREPRRARAARGGAAGAQAPEPRRAPPGPRARPGLRETGACHGAPLGPPPLLPGPLLLLLLSPAPAASTRRPSSSWCAEVMFAP